MSLLERLERERLPAKDDSRISRYVRDGYEIFIGKNAESNDTLVGGHPHRDCLWFHALSARGSHVVLCFKGKTTPSDEIIHFAARLAFKYSKSQFRSVRYARLSDVFKPESGVIGVWHTKMTSTLEVDPEDLK